MSEARLPSRQAMVDGEHNSSPPASHCTNPCCV